MELTQEKDDAEGKERQIPDVSVPLDKSTPEMRRLLDFLVIRANKWLLLFEPILNWILTLLPKRILPNLKLKLFSFPPTTWEAGLAFGPLSQLEAFKVKTYTKKTDSHTN